MSRSVEVSYKGPIIDAHTHLFNANYLPVGEIIFANYIKDHDAALGLEKIILWLTASSDLDGSGARAPLVGRPLLTSRDLTRWEKMPEEEVRAEIIRTYLQPAAAYAAALSSQERRAIRSQVRPTTLEATADRPLTAEEIAEAIETSGIAEAHALATGVTMQRKINLAGALRFMAVATSAEKDILRLYRDTYPQVTLSIHHMMDMQQSYGRVQPTHEFLVQVRRMLALQKESDGRILTSGAFDPFRREESLPYAKTQIEQGVVGLKFYPPSGYSPAENKIPPVNDPKAHQTHWDGRYKDLSDGDLDTLNMAFFDACASDGVPIFLHCTEEGYESTQGYGKLMCGPEKWNTVLAKHKDLRVGFGHAGGTGFWLGASEAGEADVNYSARFGHKVYDLCSNPEYPNVYCEAGFWSELFTEEGFKSIQENLA